MAVRHSQAVQRLSSATRRTESCSSRVGPISLGVKQMGARSAGNPHAACDVEGTGNVARSRGLSARQSSTLPQGGEAKAFLTPIEAAPVREDADELSEGVADVEAAHAPGLARGSVFDGDAGRSHPLERLVDI